MRRIYLASSWRNPLQGQVLAVLREAGHEVYDFKNPAEGNNGFGWSSVQPGWKGWMPSEFVDHLYTSALCAEGFKFDKDALDWCDTCICLLPCGRSAHLEAGYCVGQGKPTFFYIPTAEKFEPELMYLLGECKTDMAELLSSLATLDWADKAKDDVRGWMNPGKNGGS